MHDVIKGNYKIRKNDENFMATCETSGNEEEIASFDRMCGGSKKGEKMTKKRRENEEKMKGK